MVAQTPSECKYRFSKGDIVKGIPDAANTAVRNVEKALVHKVYTQRKSIKEGFVEVVVLNDIDTGTHTNYFSGSHHVYASNLELIKKTEPNYSLW